jgi:glycosyltransferase involved in cell wall biosynthesis
MTPGNDPLVSVVTTAYNEEQYIRECIDSVVGQTYRNWDYTIVDNASTDRTWQIAQQYAEKDRRIRVVRNETTVPALANLNIACRQISPAAKYCKVVAGDDWMFPTCIEQMVGIAEANPTVGIVGAYRAMGSRLDPSGLPFGVTVASGRQVCRSFLLGTEYPFGVPSSLLYSSDLVRSRTSFFDERHTEADILVCLEHLQSRDFGFVHQVLTFMREQGGTSHSVVRDNNLFLAEKLHCLVRFGPAYLDDGELKRAIAGHLVQYYEYLGSQVFNNRDRPFWALHRDRLAELGFPMNRARVAVHAFFSLMERAMRRIRKKL